MIIIYIICHIKEITHSTIIFEYCSFSGCEDEIFDMSESSLSGLSISYCNDFRNCSK